MTHKYATMTYIQRKEVFLIELLGYEKHDNLENTYRKPGDKNFACPDPFEDLNLAMMGVKKLDVTLILRRFIGKGDWRKWEATLHNPKKYVSGEYETCQEAIVEVCIRIKRPDLFTEE